MERVGRVLVSALLLCVVAGACTIETSDLEATEERYLDKLNDVLEPLRRTAEEYEKVYQDTRGRSSFENGVKGIRATSRIVRVFRSLQKTTAPPRFYRDQRALMRSLGDVALAANSAEKLARNDDIVKASTRFAHSMVLYDRMLLDRSARFCLQAAPSAGERDLCKSLKILPGAAYGERLHAILANASAEFTPRGFMFIARAFTNTEVADYLRSIGPALVDGVEEARDEIHKLIPPDEFAADHRILTDYFDSITRVSKQIAQAAQSNPDRLRSLFPESQRLVERAGGRLSKAIRPAVAVWFFPSTK